MNPFVCDVMKGNENFFVLMNISKLMSKAQAMKKELEQAQKEVDALVIEGRAKDGTVVATLLGTGVLESVCIDPSLFHSFQEMIGDLVVLAHKDAFKKLEEKKKAIMGRVHGGMDMPF